MDWIGLVPGVGFWGWVGSAVVALTTLGGSGFYLLRSRQPHHKFVSSRTVTPVDYCQEVHNALSYAYHNPGDPELALELTFALNTAVSDAHTSETELVALVADFVTHRRRVRALSIAIANSALWPILEEVLDSNDVMAQLQALSVISRLNTGVQPTGLGSRIQRLTKAKDLELARAALSLEIELDPASALNLSFNRLGQDGQWAIQRAKSLLDTGVYGEWRRRFGSRRVTEVTNLLTNAARSGSPAFRFGAVQVLERIPDRAARAALGRLAHIRHPGTKRPVTGG